MVLGDVIDAHLPPRPVLDVLPEATAAGCKPGTSGTVAWVLHRQTLLVWIAEHAESAVVRRLQVPQPLTGRPFVEVITRPAASAITVILCTPEGQLSVWLDSNFLASPFTQQIVASSSEDGSPALVSAVSASAADQGANPGFLAVVSTADGALHLYHGSQRGIFPRQFYTPTSQPAGRQKGLLGTLGNVVKAMYDEAFDPLHHTRRPAASNMPALSLILHQAQNSLWKLFVLTPESLDCWLLGAGVGQRSVEELLWSYNLFGFIGNKLHARSLRFLTACLSADLQGLVVWSAHTSSTQPSPQHLLHHLHLQADSLPVYSASAALPVTPDSKLPGLGLSGPPPVLAGWQLHPHAADKSCVALAPNGCVVLWAFDDWELVKQLSHNSDNRAACCGKGAAGGMGPRWMVLNAVHGVVELEPETVPSATAEQRKQQLEELLDTLLLLLQKEVAVGAPYRELAETLGSRLQQLGVWRTPGEGGQLLVDFSVGLVDKIAETGPSSLNPVSLQDQLEQKHLRHNLLLSALDAGGVLPCLSVQELQALMEHSEMLAAILQVLLVETELQGERATAAAAGEAPGAQPGSTTDLHAVVAAAVKATGRLVAAASESQLSGQEVLFSRPTASAPALFVAAGQQAESVRVELSNGTWNGDPRDPLQQLRGLGLLLLEAVAAANNQRASLQQTLRGSGKTLAAAAAAAVGSSWMSGSSSRVAWEQLCESCYILKPRLGDEGMRLELAAAVHLPATQQLLGSCHAALAGGGDGGGGGVSVEEFQGMAEHHLDSLLQDAELELKLLRGHGLLEGGEEAAMEEGPSTQPALATALIWPLEQLSAQHHCWPQLYCCCELLEEMGLASLAGRRQQHMEQERSRGPDSFTYWVMDKLRTTSQISELLGLGRLGFRPELLQYLRSYPSLLWQAEVAAGMFPQAGETLMVAAQAEQESVGKRSFMMNLAKLGAHAAAPTCAFPSARVEAEFTKQIAVAELGQALLRLQQDLPEPLGGSDAVPLPAPALAKAALELAEEDPIKQSLLALQALSLSSDSVRLEHRALWEEAWQGLLQEEVLHKLAALKSQQYQGGSGEDEEYKEALRGSPLFEALLQCAEALKLSSQIQSGSSFTTVVADANHVLTSLLGADEASKGVIKDVLNSALETVAATS